MPRAETYACRSARDRQEGKRRNRSPVMRMRPVRGVPGETWCRVDRMGNGHHRHRLRFRGVRRWDGCEDQIADRQFNVPAGRVASAAGQAELSQA